MTIPFKLPFFVSLFVVLSITNPAIAQADSSAIELNIFPNPNSGTFYITVINDESYQSRLYAMDGRLVKTMYLRSGLNYVSIQEPAGVYLLEVGGGEMKEQFRIVVN